MFQLLQPITSWLLIAVVLTGHLPALIHEVECGHACAVEHANTADGCGGGSSPATSCGKGCCNSTQVANATNYDLATSDHECDNCTICQSLLSTNGLVGLSDRPIASELLQVALLTVEQVAPELTRFGISQSRAPPGFSA